MQNLRLYVIPSPLLKNYEDKLQADHIGKTINQSFIKKHIEKEK